jgi:hypothetical protein
MNILETKVDVSDNLYQLIKLLSFDNHRIDVKGSASLKSQQYPSDVDLFSYIDTKYTAKDAYNIILSILNNIINTDNTYFIELKMVDKQGHKKKFFKESDFSFRTFDKFYTNIDLIKLDLITFEDNKFIEVSIIYKFNDDKIDKQTLLRDLHRDIEEYTQEHNYFKALKRLFSIYRLKNSNDQHLLLLSRIFNSNLGKEYQTIGQLEAIKLFVDTYDDKDDIRKAEFALRQIDKHYLLKDINKYIEEKKRKLNNEARPLFRQFNTSIN